MANKRPIHPDFQLLLDQKDKSLVKLFCDLRSFILELYPESNEMLYHTHALTAVLSISDKLKDGFCHIPIYSQHLNLGFNKGTMLPDPHKLLQGTGNLIRHIPIEQKSDYRNAKVTDLVNEAIAYELKDMSDAPSITGKTISKITKK